MSVGRVAIGLLATGAALVALAFERGNPPFGIRYATMLLVAAGALFVSYQLVEGRIYRRPPTMAQLPHVEQGPQIPVPGDGFDYLLTDPANEDRVREILRAVTVQTLNEDGGYGEDAARSAVEEGTWTDDPLVAAFLSEGVPDRTLAGRIRLRVQSASRLVQIARRTTDELRAIRGESE